MSNEKRIKEIEERIAKLDEELKKARDLKLETEDTKFSDKSVEVTHRELAKVMKKKRKTERAKLIGELKDLKSGLSSSKGLGIFQAHEAKSALPKEDATKTRAPLKPSGRR